MPKFVGWRTKYEYCRGLVMGLNAAHRSGREVVNIGRVDPDGVWRCWKILADRVESVAEDFKYDG